MNELLDLKLRVAALETDLAAVKAELLAAKKAEIKAACALINANPTLTLENENQPSRAVARDA